MAVAIHAKANDENNVYSLDSMHYFFYNITLFYEI